ncbi:MAG: hypothetical protein VX796_09310 [Pseudomonadota bacterium]|nr:hypothetical protein [Pseudomonadota bacterium]
MKRKHYRAGELRAGMTIFFAGANPAHEFPKPEVFEGLIVERGAIPAEGEVMPYRIDRGLADYYIAEHGIEFCRTRRQAWREARRIADARKRESLALGGSSPAP